MIILSQLWNKLCHMSNAALACKCRKVENGTYATPFSSDVYNNSTRARTRQVDGALSGRSMVEMLGVLAIIGVLSVGAIAGYQKAMFKYKLNKHAEAFNILLNNALQIQPQLECGPEQLTHYGDLFLKLNYIPDGFKYRNNADIADTFGNQMWIYQYANNGASGIGIKFQPSPEGKEICRNIVQTARENRANLKRLTTYKFYNDKPMTEEGNIYGDAYCTKERECLKDLTLEHIGRLCNVCDGRDCNLYVLWR